MAGTSRARRRSASVGFIFFTLVIDALGFGLVVPIVPLLVEELTGSTVSHASLWVGVSLAAFAIMQFIGAPILGGLSDRFGRRPVLLLSLAGVGINYLLLAWAPSLAWLILGRCNCRRDCGKCVDGDRLHRRHHAAGATRGAVRPCRRQLRLGLRHGPRVGGLLGHVRPARAVLAAGVLAACNVLYGLFVLARELAAPLAPAVRLAAGQPAGLVARAGGEPDTGAAGNFLGLQLVRARARCKRVSCWPTSSGSAGTRSRTALALALAGLGSAVVQGLLVRKIIPALGEWRAAMTGSALAVVAYLLIAFAPFGWVVLLGIVIQASALSPIRQCKAWFLPARLPTGRARHRARCRRCRA